MDRELSQWKTQFDSDISKELSEMGYVHEADQNEKACRERAMTVFNAEISAATEAWTTDSISYDSYVERCESAQESYKNAMNSCRT